MREVVRGKAGARGLRQKGTWNSQGTTIPCVAGAQRGREGYIQMRAGLVDRVSDHSLWLRMPVMQSLAHVCVNNFLPKYSPLLLCPLVMVACWAWQSADGLRCYWVLLSHVHVWPMAAALASQPPTWTHWHPNSLHAFSVLFLWDLLLDITIPLTNLVTMRKLHNHSEPQIPHCLLGDNSTSTVGWLWWRIEWNSKIHVRLPSTVPGTQ